MLRLDVREGGQTEGHLHISIKKAVIAVSPPPSLQHAKLELAWSELNPGRFGKEAHIQCNEEQELNEDSHVRG